jgi:hypothetical protein
MQGLLNDSISTAGEMGLITDHASTFQAGRYAVHGA